MEKDRIRWNRKHQKTPCAEAPSDIVRRFIHLARPGKSLVVAAGLGRNALFLAEQGFDTEAVDISDVAVERMTGRHPRLSPLREDLDTYTVSPNRYRLILNIRFLNRRLFPYIREGLKPGGVLIFQSFMEGKAGDFPEITCRDHLLRRNELLHAFLSLRIVYYREEKVDHPKCPPWTASLVAVKPND